MALRPAKTLISLGSGPIFTVRMKKVWVLSYSLSIERRLVSLGHDRQIGVFAWHTATLLVFSHQGSNTFGRPVISVRNLPEPDYNLVNSKCTILTIRVDIVTYFPSFNENKGNVSFSFLRKCISICKNLWALLRENLSLEFLTK